MSVGACAGAAAPVAIDDGKDYIGRSRRGRLSLAIGSLGILLLVAGCTKVGPDFVKPDATKDTMAERTNRGDLLAPDKEETAMPPRSMPDDSYRWPDW